LLTKISDHSVKMIEVCGDEGIGKTRLVQEVGRFIIKRKVLMDEVYYLDFTNVETQKQINELFKSVRIDYLLKDKKSEEELTAISKSEQSLDKKRDGQRILLIYDGVDMINQ